MLKHFVGATFAGICLIAVVFASPAAPTEIPANPYADIYAKNFAGLKAPDQSLDGVLAPTSELAADAFAKTGAQSKTCSQRCSTTCSKTCTTTRGCSSNCKRQTDGCGGGGTAIAMPPIAPPAVAALPSTYDGAIVIGKTHFTLGSTEAEVQRVMGTPSTVVGGGWYYGYSFVAFSGQGGLVGYSNVGNNLKVALRPSSTTPKQDTFGTGSNRDEVLSAQGTPTAVTGDTWNYGPSFVRFANGRVASYSNVAKNLKLH